MAEERRVPVLWIILTFVRNTWTLVGQTGYIHPDEFFQTVEVVAGDVMEVESVRTWEFNATAPIRSMVLPYAIYGPAFFVLKRLALSDTSVPMAGSVWVSARNIMIAPRLIVTVLGLFGDALVFATARTAKLPAAPVLLTFASSYIAIVFNTRTLTNTLEVFIFIVLMFCIVTSLKRHDAIMQRRETREALSENLKDDDKRLRNRRNRRVEESKPKASSKRKDPPPLLVDLSMPIGICLTVGFFNRPTFLIFAFVPVTTWLLYGCLDGKFYFSVFVTRLRYMYFYAFITFCLFVAGDTAYYGSLKAESEPDADITLSFLRKLTITPWNFIRYNLNSSNLAQHGTHSRLTHLLVNAPILFNLLAGFAYVMLFIYVYDAVRGAKKAERPKYGLRYGPQFFLACFVVPLLLLSVFPHQEPRFLLPLLMPLCLLFGHFIFGEKAKFLTLYVWIILNLMGAVFYGALHQAGVIPAINQLREEFATSLHDERVTHVVFFHTYMPPKHLFALPTDQSKQLPTLASAEQFTPVSPVTSDMHIHDLKGGSFADLESKIDQLFGAIPRHTEREKFRVAVVSPASLDGYFCSRSNRFNYTLHDQFSPHVTLEDLPAIDEVHCEPSYVSDACNRDCRELTPFQRVKSILSLYVYNAKPRR